METMLRPDTRQYSQNHCWHGRCRGCGEPLVILHDDARDGYCFACYDPLEGGLHR